VYYGRSDRAILEIELGLKNLCAWLFLCGFQNNQVQVGKAISAIPHHFLRLRQGFSIFLRIAFRGGLELDESQAYVLCPINIGKCVVCLCQTGGEADCLRQRLYGFHSARARRFLIGGVGSKRIVKLA
jgi:hypothetical protein